MISVREAVANAFKFIGEMYEDKRVSDARLEEVELSEDQRSWYITVSFVTETPSALAQALNPLGCERLYKVVEVSSASGEIGSMKMRNPARA